MEQGFHVSHPENDWDWSSPWPAKQTEQPWRVGFAMLRAWSEWCQRKGPHLHQPAQMLWCPGSQILSPAVSMWSTVLYKIGSCFIFPSNCSTVVLFHVNDSRVCCSPSETQKPLARFPWLNSLCKNAFFWIFRAQRRLLPKMSQFPHQNVGIEWNQP